MADKKAILHHYLLDGTGAGTEINSGQAAPAEDKTVWLHLNAGHADTKKILKDELHLDPLIVKAMLKEETRPRLEEIGENALIILRGIQFNPGPTPEDLVSIRLWVGKNRVVSVVSRRTKALVDMPARIQQQHGPRHAGEFIAMLCSQLHDGIEPAIVELEDTTDVLEEQSLDHPEQESIRTNLAVARKQAILFRRHMAPQRDVVSRLQNSRQAWMTDTDRWHMKDNLDRVTRYLEDLDSVRERSQIVQEELAGALTVRLNRNIYRLSMITVVFMPLSFLTGLLGSNVAGIPGADHPAAFAVVGFILFCVGALELWLFRRLKWI